MITAERKNFVSRLFVGLEDWLEDHPSMLSGLQIFPILAAIAYGWGWIFVNRFFGEFGLTSEEVGVDSSWLIVRSVIFVLSISIIALLIVSLNNLVHIWPRKLTFVLTLKEVGVHGKTINWDLRLFLKFIVAFFTTFMAALFIIAPFFFATFLAHEVKSGKEIHVPVPPAVIGMRVDKVTVWPASPDMTIPGIKSNGKCLLRFGSREGTSIFYDTSSQNILRVNDQNVAVQGGC